MHCVDSMIQDCSCVTHFFFPLPLSSSLLPSSSSPSLLHPRTHTHQVFKEEEEAVKVELHEGCGRIKLYWTMALVDYRTLKGLIEFREAGSGEGSLVGTF